MSNETQEVLQSKLGSFDKMPTVPAVLYPLLQQLEQPLERVEVHKVIDLISQDKSLAIQCLQMANSPLFGRWQGVDSVRSAVVSLGLQKISDIAVSCSMLQLLPDQPAGIDPVVFWEHSLACALVCRQFARKIGFKNAGKAYLGGLLHDIGVVAHLWVLPKEFKTAFDLGKSRGMPLDHAETEILGFNHAESGRKLAERWALTPDLVSIIGYHHDAGNAPVQRDLVALVALGDVLCRMSGLGHGYVERRQVDILEEPAFSVLLQECPSLQTFDWARFTFELEGYIEEVHRMVALLYRK